MKCSFCGSNNSDGSTNCTNCGAPLKKKKSSVISLEVPVETKVEEENIAPASDVAEEITQPTKVVVSAPSVETNEEKEEKIDSTQTTAASADEISETEEVGAVVPVTVEKPEEVIIQAPPPIDGGNHKNNGSGSTLKIALISVLVVVVAAIGWLIFSGKDDDGGKSKVSSGATNTGTITPKPKPITVDKYITNSNGSLALTNDAEKHVQQFTREYLASVAADKGIKGVTFCDESPVMEEDYKKVRKTFASNKINEITVSNGEVADLVVDGNSISCKYNFKAEVKVGKSKKIRPANGSLEIKLEAKNRDLVVTKVRKWSIKG